MQERMNPWSPITNPTHLKILGKCAEETSELGNVLARIIVQGLDESEPTTGKPNKEWLEDEIADVVCTTSIVIDYFGLDYERMKQRALDKCKRLNTWFDMPVKEEA